MLICVCLYIFRHLIWKNKQLSRGRRHSVVGIGNHCSLEFLSCFLSFAVNCCWNSGFPTSELLLSGAAACSPLTALPAQSCGCLCLGTYSGTTRLSTFPQSVIAHKTNFCSYISLLRNALSLNPNLYPDYN